LTSLAGRVDEIVVVDTGSEDSTPEIAKSHGVRLLSFAWCNDFAAARNFGLDAAAGEWILYIDADERLVDTTSERLHRGLDDARAFAARVRFRPTVNGTLVREYRLFRNDRRLRFRGAMHETIRPDLDGLERSIGAQTIDSSASLVHLGYEGDLSAKHRRNLPLLRVAVETNPERLYYWNHLAETISALGDREAALGLAEEALERSQARYDAGSRLMRAALAATAARLRLALGRDALPLIEFGLEMRPDDATLTFLKAKALVELGRYDEALAITQELASVDGESYLDTDISHDRRIFGAYAYDLSGLALLRMGRKADAAQSFTLAAKVASDDPSYRIKALALGAPPF
jgi:tetratricopeptide (TPR) repeat protein